MPARPKDFLGVAALAMALCALGPTSSIRRRAAVFTLLLEPVPASGEAGLCPEGAERVA